MFPVAGRGICSQDAVLQDHSGHRKPGIGLHCVRELAFLPPGAERAPAIVTLSPLSINYALGSPVTISRHNNLTLPLESNI